MSLKPEQVAFVTTHAVEQLRDRVPALSTEPHATLDRLILEHVRNSHVSCDRPGNQAYVWVEVEHKDQLLPFVCVLGTSDRPDSDDIGVITVITQDQANQNVRDQRRTLAGSQAGPLPEEPGRPPHRDTDGIEIVVLSRTLQAKLTAQDLAMLLRGEHTPHYPIPDIPLNMDIRNGEILATWVEHIPKVIKSSG